MKFPRFWAKSKKAQPAPATGKSKAQAQQEILDRTTVQAGRKAIDDSSSQSNSAIARQYLEYHGRDMTSLISYTSIDLLRILFALDSTASHALSNFLRVFDSGYFMTVRDFEGQPMEAGQQFIDMVIQRYEQPVGEGFSPDTAISQLCNNAVIYALFHGAMAFEVVFDPGSFINTGIYLIDPSDIDFKKEQSTGVERLVPYYTGGRNEVSMDYKNFVYVPIDPILDDPYGTSQFISAITPIMNKVRLLQDFARALKNLGFDRIDIEVDEAALIEACKKRGIKDPEEIEKTINRVIDSARDSFASLDVDDNPAHLSSIQLKPLEGRNSGTHLDVASIVNIMMSDIASGLKTFATILGKGFNRSSEGYQSIEALLYLKMVAGFHKIVERAMERIFTLVLQVEGGIPGVVDFEFLESSIRPQYESAQYFNQYQTMLWQSEKLGFVSQAESARLVRKMLSLSGDPPADAKRDEAYTPGAQQPQRDAGQEQGKEDKKRETKDEKRTKPDGK